VSQHPVRALGVDLGQRRIGVAVSDGEGTVATPVEVVDRNGDIASDHRRLAALVEEWEAKVVVVGLPLSLDGGRGPAALAALGEVEHLARAVGVPVTTYDERFTTVTARSRLREAGHSDRSQRKIVDMHAAAVLLQAWLDHRAEENRPTGESTAAT